VRKFESNPRHPTALDYTRYGISVENPLLVKIYMKSRFRDGKHHHIFVLMDKAKIGRDSVIDFIVYVKVVLELSAVAVTL